MADIYDQFKDFKSFEAVFTDRDQQPQRLFCSVKSIENNRIILNASKKDNKDVFAEEGTELKLHIYTEHGIYSAVSKVLLATKGLVNNEYIISYPANSKHSQRREYFRADLAVHFIMTVGLDNHGQVISIDSQTKNICGKGMSYISDKPFPDYTMVDIELLFKEKSVRTYANLVYSKPIVIANRPKFIHAFSFTNISSTNIDLIVKKCFLHQLNLRKKQST